MSAGCREERAGSQDPGTNVLRCLNSLAGFRDLVTGIPETAQPGDTGVELGENVGLGALAHESATEQSVEDFGCNGPAAVGGQRWVKWLSVGEQVGMRVDKAGQDELAVEVDAARTGEMRGFVGRPDINNGALLVDAYGVVLKDGTDGVAGDDGTGFEDKGGAWAGHVISLKRTVLGGRKSFT